MNNHSLKGHIRKIMLAGVLTGTAGMAWAGDFSVSDNKVTIDSAGSSTGANQSIVTVNSSGVVTDAVLTSTTTDATSLPKFTITLVNNDATATSASYSVRVGVIIVDQNTSANRRIEAVLGTLNLTTDSNADVDTVTIPATSNARIRARDGSVNLSVDNIQGAISEANVVDGDGGSTLDKGAVITFDANQLVTNAVQNNALFQEIVDGLNVSGTYQYTILLQPTGTDMRVGVGGTSFTSFPVVRTSCGNSGTTSSSLFELSGNGSTFASEFTSAFGFRGGVGIGGDNPGPISALVNCTEPAATGGGAAEEEEEEQPVDEQVTNVGNDADAIDINEGDGSETVTEEVVEQVNNVAEEAATTAQNVTNAINDGSSGLDVAATAIESLNKVFSKAATARERGGAVNNETVRNGLRNAGSLLDSVADRASELSDEQKSTISTQVKETVQSSSRMISDESTDDEVEDIANSLTEVLSNTARAGIPIDEEFKQQAQDMAQRAAAVTVRRQLGDAIGDVDTNDPDELRQLLTDNADAREAVLDVFPALRSTEPSSVSRNIQNPNGQNIGGRTTTDILREALGLNTGTETLTALFGPGTSVQAAEHGELGVSVDDETGIVTITLANERYTGAIHSTKLAPGAMPEGIDFLRNGSGLIVNDGVAIQISPVAADMTAFGAAVTDAGFDLDVGDNGSIEIDLGDGELFSGAFAYDNQSGAQGACGAISIAEPTGAATAAGYTFGVNCENGIEQNVVPFPNRQAFFRAVRASELTVSADRNTGFVTIDGQQRFRPSFYVSPLTLEDATYRDENGVRGVAFRAVDVNGDGMMDYQVIFEDGVQVFYGTP